METPPAGVRIYRFDELFITVFRTTLIQRKSPNSPFELRSVKLMLLLILISVVNIITVLVSAINLFERENLSALCGVGATVAGIIIRAFGIVMNRDVVKSLLTKLEDLFPASSEDQFKYNLPRYINPIIRRNRITGLLLSSAVFAFTIIPLLKSVFFCLVQGQKYSFTYPFMDSFPIDDSQLIYYVLIYSIQIAWSVTGVLIFFYENLVFSNSVTQMCMHYQFVCQSLSHLDAKNKLESHRELRKLIRLQNALTLIRDDVNTIFSLSTFFGFIVIKISICMYVFSLVDADSTNLMNLFRYTISILILMITVYQRCSLGTVLCEESLKIINSIYDSNWYEGTPRYRKMLAIMMIRANVPIELEASPLNCIGIEYFKELTIQTYEFFMFLINFSK